MLAQETSSTRARRLQSKRGTLKESVLEVTMCTLCLPCSCPFPLGEMPQKWNCKDKRKPPHIFSVRVFFYSVDKLNFFLKLDLWEWQWLMRLCRFQAHLSATRHLSIALCARPQSSSPPITMCWVALTFLLLLFLILGSLKWLA